MIAVSIILVSSLVLPVNAQEFREQIFVNSFLFGKIFRVDIETGASVELGTFIGNGIDVAIHPITEKVYFTKLIPEGQIVSINPDGTNLVTIFSSANLKPSGLTFDQMGNLYFTTREGIDGRIYKIVGGNPTNSPIPVTDVTLGFGTGILIDGNGNLWGLDGSPVKVINFGTSFSPTNSGTVIFTSADGFTNPSGIAEDSLGRLYVASVNAKKISRFNPDGTGLETFASGLVHPNFIDFDSQGNLFVIESSSLDDSLNRITKIAPDGTKTILTTIGDSFFRPNGIAIGLVLILDPNPPVITCPADLLTQGTSPSGIDKNDPEIQAFLNGVSATDDQSIPNITNDAPDVFPLGDTIVTFNAADIGGNQSSCNATVSVEDPTVPIGTIIINNGDLFTSSLSATLLLTCVDDVGCTEMQVAVDGTADTEPFEPFAATKQVTLLAGDGTKTVAVKFRDAAGNTSPQFTDNIFIDPIGPSGTLVINNDDAFTGSQTVTIDLTCSDGSGSGCSQMRIRGDLVELVNIEPFVTSKTITLTSLDGMKTIIVILIDAAGNQELPVPQDSIILDTTPPTGGVSINGGDSSTTSTSVTLTFTCNDARSGCSEMQVAEDGTIDTEPFEPFTTTKTATLPTGEGLKIVLVKFKDAVGNISFPTADSIIIDLTPPTIGPVIPTTANLDVPIILSATYSDNFAISDCFLNIDGKFQTGTATLSGSPTSGTASKSHTFSTIGDHQVFFFCRDDAGFSESSPLTTVTVIDPTSADLSIAKADSSDPATAGNQLTYTLTVDNFGPNDASNVIVTDTLPAEVILSSISSSQGGCTSLPCNLGTIANGAFATVTIIVNVDPNTVSTFTNNASVSSDNTDTDSTNNVVTETTGVISSTANIGKDVVIGEGTVIGDGTTVSKNVVIGDGVVIGNGDTLEQNVVIGQGTVIGDGTAIERDVQIGDNCVIGNNVVINKGTVVGNNVQIGDNTIIEQNVVIGSNAIIGNNVLIEQSVTILDGAVVPDGALIPAGTTFP